MKAFVNNYNKFIDKVTQVCGVVAGILIFLTAIATFIEVVMRGIFNSPTEWAIEMSVYFVLVAGFLGMPVAYAAGKHINVDIFVSTRTPKAKCYLQIVSCILAIIFCAIFTYEAMDMSLTSLDLDRLSPSTLRVPLWIPQMSLPIGMGLLVLQFLGTFMKDAMMIKDGDYESKGAAK